MQKILLLFVIAALAFPVRVQAACKHPVRPDGKGGYSVKIDHPDSVLVVTNDRKRFELHPGAPIENGYFSVRWATMDYSDGGSLFVMRLQAKRPLKVYLVRGKTGRSIFRYRKIGRRSD